MTCTTQQFNVFVSNTVIYFPGFLETAFVKIPGVSNFVFLGRLGRAILRLVLSGIILACFECGCKHFSIKLQIFSILIFVGSFGGQ